jgi:hypothetical protein
MGKSWFVPVAVGAAVLLGAWQFWQSRPVDRPPGVLTPLEPVQQALSTGFTRSKNGFTVTGLATFSLRARVILKRDYGDEGAALAPVDVAFGWGPMSDSRVLSKLQFGQFGRWYTYQWSDEPPLEPGIIALNSANMHLIPANGSVEAKLRALRSGNIVTLSGYLVRANRADGFTWVSSLTRADTGDGACELVWVEALEVR